MTPTCPKRLGDYPLWRLLVMLDDAERIAGADSDTARAIAATVLQKLRAQATILEVCRADRARHGGDTP